MTIIRRFALKIPPEATDRMLVYHLVKEFNIKVNILRATINEGHEGRLVMETEAEEEALNRGAEFLQAEGISMVALDQHLSLEREKCVHCGACTAVCSTGALHLNRDKWEVEFDSDKCVVCGVCSIACPLKIISVEFR